MKVTPIPTPIPTSTPTPTPRQWRQPTTAPEQLTQRQRQRHSTRFPSLNPQPPPHTWLNNLPTPEVDPNFVSVMDGGDLHGNLPDGSIFNSWFGQNPYSRGDHVANGILNTGGAAVGGARALWQRALNPAISTVTKSPVVRNIAGRVADHVYTQRDPLTSAAGVLRAERRGQTPHKWEDKLTSMISPAPAPMSSAAGRYPTGFGNMQTYDPNTAKAVASVIGKTMDSGRGALDSLYRYNRYFRETAGDIVEHTPEQAAASMKEFGRNIYTMTPEQREAGLNDYSARSPGLLHGEYDMRDINAMDAFFDGTKLDGVAESLPNVGWVVDALKGGNQLVHRAHVADNAEKFPENYPPEVAARLDKQYTDLSNLRAALGAVDVVPYLGTAMSAARPLKRFRNVAKGVGVGSL